jgi:hypothetical protein
MPTFIAFRNGLFLEPDLILVLLLVCLSVLLSLYYHPLSS